MAFDYVEFFKPKRPFRKGFKVALRIMKLTSVFLLAICLQVSAGTLAQSNVSLNETNAPLDKILKSIRQQTGYGLVYFDAQLKQTKPVTINVKNMPLEKVLDVCFEGQPVTFEIVDKAIVVKPREKKVDDIKLSAPPVDIHGRIVNEEGDPVANASVIIKGSKKGVSTDLKGEFTLRRVDGDAILIISGVNIEDLEIAIKGRSELGSVNTKTRVGTIPEVVVNKGYYQVKQKDNTGNVTVVKGEDIQKQPVSDPILALSGRVPGMYIQQTSGLPGAYATIRIRGQNSIANGNDPLYIVDGVPFSAVSLSSIYVSSPLGGAANPYYNQNGQGLSPFNGLNPGDIESVEILKDADATAIYGSRGANGVVLITTKKGKAGTTRFNLNVFTGAGTVAHHIDLLNTQQYLAMRREAFKNDGLSLPSIATDPSDFNYDINGFWDTTRYTDWQKELIGGTARYTSLQGDLSGGSENTQFLIGAGYSSQGNVFPGDYKDQKISGHVNLDHSSSDRRFVTQFTASYVHDNNNLPGVDPVSNITLAPDAPPLYDKLGNINWAIFQGTATFFNPLAATLTSSSAVTDNLVSNLNLRYRILPGLDIKSSFGYSHGEMSQIELLPSTAIAPPYNTGAYASSQFANTVTNSWIIEPQLSYQRSLGAGRLDILAGASFQQNKFTGSTQSGMGFSSDALLANLQSAATVSVTPTNNIIYHYTAAYARVGYKWKEKYLVNLTARRDGSSRFGPGKQFGNFGSAGAGWIFSKEGFVERNLHFLSFGKLRASYGITGSDQIADYQYLSTFSSGSTAYQGINGLNPTRLTNPYFAWEVDKKLEAGLELGFAQDRIYVSASYYRNRTGNQLVGLPLPYTAGFTSVQYNLPATLQNTGVELMLSSVNIRSKRFEWTTALNGTLPSNKLVSFPGLASSVYANVYAIGHSIYSHFVYRNTGINPQTGIYSFDSKNTSGNPGPRERVLSRPVTQKFYGGIQNKITHNGFTLDFFIQYVNQTALNYQNAFASSPGEINYNQPVAALDRWEKAGDIAVTQRFGTGLSTYPPYSNLKLSDAIITDASFLRLKSLAVSWQTPASWNQKMHLTSARIYIQCQNIFTITHYPFLDPETAGSLSVPPVRMLTAGIQVGL